VETHAAQDVAAGPFQQIKLDWGTKVVFGVTPDGAHHRRERLTFPVPGLQLNERVGVPG
jgi:hypothetical protein